MVRIAFLLFGIAFGYILIKSGVSNYDVIREMFLLQSWHLYGVLATAVTTTFVLTQIMKRLETKAILTGQPIDMSVKKLTKNHLYGGLICGLGWAITGACPGPALAQVGFGTMAGIFTMAGAFLGTYLYGVQQKA
ncbi:MAG: YeeE/YedE family protein [Candidatus Polarisedimenticolaceae bacterium]|nr:YeeE/YedE family protein [Candidatus Polarisedimenticolaceae bacterium]